MLAMKWNDYVSKVAVCTLSDQDLTETTVRRRRLSMFGHEARMSDDAPPRWFSVLHVTPERQRGGDPPDPH